MRPILTTAKDEFSKCNINVVNVVKFMLRNVVL